MVDKLKYAKWFKIAREVLGSELVGELKKDEEVVTWVSSEDWLMLPLPTETNMEAAINRIAPNIYIVVNYPLKEESLLDDDASDAKVIPGKITIGLTCNTINAVNRMRNILDGFHNTERESLLSALKRLDDGFETSVHAKITEYHFSQVPRYDCEFKEKSNKLDEACIRTIFEKVDEIRSQGLQLRDRGRKYPVKLPVFELARCEFPICQFSIAEQTFREKLQALKPVFEACLRIKSETEIKKAKKEMEDSRITFACRNCGRKFSAEEYDKNKFCPICGGLILPK